MQGYGVLRKSVLLSRTAPFDCGLANWSRMSRAVKVDMLVCMVSAVTVLCIFLSMILIWFFKNAFALPAKIVFMLLI